MLLICLFSAQPQIRRQHGSRSTFGSCRLVQSNPHRGRDPQCRGWRSKGRRRSMYRRLLILFRLHFLPTGHLWLWLANHPGRTSPIRPNPGYHCQSTAAGLILSFSSLLNSSFELEFFPWILRLFRLDFFFEWPKMPVLQASSLQVEKRKKGKKHW